MKMSKKLFAGFLFLFALSLLLCSCPSTPEPKLTEPKVTLALSQTSPQSEVIISWTPSDEAESYTIERTMVRDSITETRKFEWKDNDDFCSKNYFQYSFKDTTCESGTEYSYVVIACAERQVPFCVEYYTKESKKESITTAVDPNVTLAYPKNVSVEQTNGNQNALTVKWDAVENAASYEVYFVHDNYYHDYNEKYIKVAATEQTSFIQNHLCNETNYSFMIKAVNGTNYSLFSAKASGRVAEAKNVTKNTAFVLENGVRDYFFSGSESLWFECTLQKGIIKLYHDGNKNAYSLSVFTKEGSVAASGLPLFTIDDENTGIKDIPIVDSDYPYAFGVERNLKNDINGFSEGTTYLLRISKFDICYSFSICVE